MDLTWINKRERVLGLYFSSSITVDDVSKLEKECDCLQIWYPITVDEEIIRRYKPAIHYIGLEGEWGKTEHSWEVDLAISEEDVYNGFSKNNRYEIRKARDEYHIETELCIANKDILDEFVDFYNIFAGEKNLPHIDTAKYIAAVKQNKLVISKAIYKNRIIVMHAYFYWHNEGFATLAASCSHFREIESEIKKIISYSNVYLHYKDMLKFKNEGAKVCDLGGYRTDDEFGNAPNDRQRDLITISQFKKRLGGHITNYSASFVINVREFQIVQENLEKIENELVDKCFVIWGAGNWGKYIIRKIDELYGLKPLFIVDNKLCDNNSKYVCQDRLALCDEDTIIVLTMSEHIINDVLNLEVLNRFKKKNKIRCVTCSNMCI